MQKKMIKVLLIDDDEDSYYLIRGLLSDISRGQYLLTWEHNYAAATHRLKQNDQDVCLLDYRLGEYTGVDVLRVAHEQGFTAPIIILTGEGDRNVDVAAMRAGAVDYLPKGKTDASLLEHAIRYAIAHSGTLDALRKSERRYKTLLEAVTNYMYIVTVENGQAVQIAHSASCQAVTGYSAEEFLAEADLWQRIVHVSDRLQVFWQTDQALSGKAVLPIEYRICHKEGWVHWVRNTIVLRHNDQGVLIGYDGLVADITERRKLEDHLRYIGQHDTLTGLHNRAFFSEEMRRLEQSNQYPISLIIADMDGLKAVNDDQGHHAGDDMLKRAAVLLKRAFLAEDVVARLGGDEFGMLLLRADTADAEKKLAQIRAELRADNQAHPRLPLSISLGAATVHRGGLLSVGLKHADQLMYQDKVSRQTVHQKVRAFEAIQI